MFPGGLVAAKKSAAHILFKGSLSFYDRSNKNISNVHKKNVCISIQPIGTLNEWK
jgi:hypothetical protein